METIDSAFPEFQASVLTSKRRGDRVLAPLCGALALLFYWLLTPHCLPPGAPAELTATAMGLTAQSPPFHLLWRSLASLAAHIPVGTMTVKLALLSALCSAVAASLVYQVSVELMMHRLIPNGTQIDRLKIRAVQLGGVVAALAFATASPVALAATRASLRSLDVVLLLAAVWLFLRYYDGNHVLHLLLAGTVCGLGMGENPGCCAAFVVVLLWGIILLWRQDRSTLPMLAFAGLALIIMLLLYPGLCYLRHLAGGDALQLLGGHYRELLQDYTSSRTGLFLGALSLLPLVLALVTLNQTLNYSEDYESLLTLSALAIAALLILTNAFPSFRNFALLNPEPPVLPYLFAAMTAGFVSACWWTIALNPSSPGEELDENDLHHPGTLHVVKGFGYGVAIAIISGIGFAGFMTMSGLRSRPDGYPQLCAETILRNLGTRQWLFGRTPANTHLAVLTRDRGLHLRILPLTADPSWSPRMRQSIEKLVSRDASFNGLDRTQLAEALTLGPDVFLRTWLLSDPLSCDKVAIAGPPLIWSSCSFAPIPELFFFGASATPCLPRTGFADQAVQAEQTRLRAASGGLVDGTMTHVLASADQALSASAAYAAAAFRQAGATNAAAALTSCWETPRAPPPERRSLFATPLTWVWETTVLPGRPEGNDILHTIRGDELLSALEQKDDAASARRTTAFVSRQSRTTGNFTEIYTLARNSANMAMVNQTFSWLGQLDQAGAPAAQLLVLRAVANLAVTGSVEQACALLQEATATFPRDLWAQHLHVAALLQRGEIDRAERDLLPAMEKAGGDAHNDLVRLTRALILCARGGPASLRTARTLFVDVANANPDLLVAREWALRLDVLLNDDAATIRDADILVACDENHAQANYALALIAVRTRQLADADHRFRQSLTGAMTPQALVGRARLHCQRHMVTEALQLARKATSEYPAYADGWLVLGDALDASGKPGEAAVVRSRAAQPVP
jgi:tetratricopeptide (TPR) repeat protein